MGWKRFYWKIVYPVRVCPFQRHFCVVLQEHRWLCQSWMYIHRYLENAMDRIWLYDRQNCNVYSSYHGCLKTTTSSLKLKSSKWSHSHDPHKSDLIFIFPIWVQAPREEKTIRRRTRFTCTTKNVLGDFNGKISRNNVFTSAIDNLIIHANTSYNETDWLRRISSWVSPHQRRKNHLKFQWN